jgi:hypothetical protein
LRKKLKALAAPGFKFRIDQGFKKSGQQIVCYILCKDHEIEMPVGYNPMDHKLGSGLELYWGLNCKDCCGLKFIDFEADRENNEEQDENEDLDEQEENDDDDQEIQEINSQQIRPDKRLFMKTFEKIKGNVMKCLDGIKEDCMAKNDSLFSLINMREKFMSDISTSFNNGLKPQLSACACK